MKTSAISSDYQALGERVADLLGNPAVAGLYLPAPVEDETFRDEFGFVFLADGSAGPFYVSMGDILQRLWQRHPDPAAYRGDALGLLQGFASTDMADRALAQGTYNALSTALYRGAGFQPPDRTPNSGLSDTPPGMLVGMVGYFAPLVEKLTAQGCRVLVLEQAPERVTTQPGVAVTTDPRALRDCPQVLCSASTLINDSLEAVLAAVDPRARFELIGPSGSGLPDPLFARGVSAVGGSLFGEKADLVERLQRGESWGSASRKYQLDPTSYPGLEQLIARLTDGGAHPGQA